MIRKRDPHASLRRSIAGIAVRQECTDVLLAPPTVPGGLSFTQEDFEHIEVLPEAPIVEAISYWPVISRVAGVKSSGELLNNILPKNVLGQLKDFEAAEGIRMKAPPRPMEIVEAIYQQQQQKSSVVQSQDLVTEKAVALVVVEETASATPEPIVVKAPKASRVPLQVTEVNKPLHSHPKVSISQLTPPPAKPYPGHSIPSTPVPFVTKKDQDIVNRYRVDYARYLAMYKDGLKSIAEVRWEAFNHQLLVFQQEENLDIHSERLYHFGKRLAAKVGFNQADPAYSVYVDEQSENWGEYFEERAAIFEYEGKMTQVQAEELAALHTLYSFLLKHYPSVLESFDAILLKKEFQVLQGTIPIPKI